MDDRDIEEVIWLLDKCRVFLMDVPDSQGLREEIGEMLDRIDPDGAEEDEEDDVDR